MVGTTCATDVEVRKSMPSTLRGKEGVKNTYMTFTSKPYSLHNFKCFNHKITVNVNQTLRLEENRAIGLQCELSTELCAAA